MNDRDLAPSMAPLAVMLGRWSGEETVHPAAGGPEDATVEVENRPGLGGAVILHDYRQTRANGDVFHGHAVIRLDADAGEYVMHWFDGAGSHTPFRGRLEGASISFQSDSADFDGRCRFDFEDGAYDFKMEVAVGGPWAPYLDGRYVKA